jgi:hypothetical protein
MNRIKKTCWFVSICLLGLIPTLSAAALVGTLEQLSPNPTVYTELIDFRVFGISDDGTVATGTVSGSLQGVDLGSLDSGCQAADFAGFTAGNIALIQRGDCAFDDKVVNAQNAGAAGALIFDNSNVFPGVALNDPTAIVALFLTDDLGQFFASQLGTTGIAVRFSVSEVAGVSEPGVLGLLAVGLLGLALRRKK